MRLFRSLNSILESRLVRFVGPFARGLRMAVKLLRTLLVAHGGPFPVTTGGIVRLPRFVERIEAVANLLIGQGETGQTTLIRISARH